MVRAFLPVLLTVPALAGCVIADVAKTAVDVVAVPVKVVGKGIDAALPSQKRADEKRGRELREADDRRARDERVMADRCRKNRPLPGDLCTTGQANHR
ncbi:MAG: hypothetical protein M3N06_01000 [Pseudomonadota bacterium]|jgi:hypothetical protein|nr:hypothetical protein [Pseudomonadota bacterium]